LQRVVGLADRRRRERVRGDDVRPRSEVGTVNVANDVRAGQVEEIGVAGDVAGVIAKPFAAIRVLTAHGALNEDAVRTVEHDDALVQKLSELINGRLHENTPAQRGQERGSVALYAFGKAVAKLPP